jgi:hypothetical protein
MAQRSNFLSAECNLRTTQHMDTQQCGQQHSEGNGGDARDAYLIHVALTHSRNDEDTLKAARRSLLCFDADSFFPIPPPWPRSASLPYFRMPPRPEWSRFLHPRADLAAVAWATIHEAKGSERGGVCVVVPPGDYTEELIAAWENRTDSEPKRVIYVGVTRAEKLLAIALPAMFVQRVAAVLCTGEVPFEIHDLTVAAAVGA